MNTLSIPFLLTNSLAWALLYSLAQGMVVYAFLFVLLKAIGGATARTKYAISVSGMATVFVWFAYTWAQQYQKLAIASQSIPGQGDASTAPQAGNSALQAVASFQQTHGYWATGILNTMQQHSALIISLYSLGLGLMTVRFILSLAKLRAMGKSGIPLSNPYWQGKIEYWQHRFSISRPVKLLLSARVSAPVMLGYAKPIILLPIATFSHLTAEQVETILLHELAHIKRHDYLINMLQVAGETILFFNPFVWLISSVIREQREHCCDDMVIANTTSPLPYANALAILETSRVNNSLSLAATGNKKQLFNRIKRIMEMKKTNTNYGQLGLIIVAFTAITFSLAMINPTFAQKVKKAITKTTSQTTVSSGSSAANADSVAHKKTVKIIKHSGVDDSSNVNIAISIDGDDENGGTIAVAKNGHKVFTTQLKELETALAGVDWASIKDEINKSLNELDKELNSSKLKKEININIQRHLEDARAELEDAKREMANKKIAISLRTDGGKDGEIATADVHPDFEAMLNDMAKDGLIDRSKKFKVKKEGGELYINGDKQPAATMARYKNYLDAETIKINGSKGSLNISVED